MALLRNGIYGYRTFSPIGFLGSLPKYSKNFATNTLTWQNKGGDADSRSRVSFPSGLSTSSFYMPIKDGSMRCTITARGDILAGISAIANMQSNLVGSGAIVPPTLYRARSMNVTITSVGGITFAAIESKSNMQCVIRIGANPSAFDIAQAIWTSVAENYNQVGTMGNKLNSAGAAGNPWTDTSDYPAGTKGADLKTIKTLGLYVAGDK